MYNDEGEDDYCHPNRMNYTSSEISPSDANGDDYFSDEDGIAVAERENPKNIVLSKKERTRHARNTARIRGGQGEDAKATVAVGKVDDDDDDDDADEKLFGKYEVEASAHSELPEGRSYREIFKAPDGLFRRLMGHHYGYSVNHLSFIKESKAVRGGGGDGQTGSNSPSKSSSATTAKSIFENVVFSEDLLPPMRLYPSESSQKQSSYASSSSFSSFSNPQSSAVDPDASPNGEESFLQQDPINPCANVLSAIATSNTESNVVCDDATNQTNTTANNTTNACDQLPSAVSTVLFSTLETPEGMKDSPASKFLRKYLENCCGGLGSTTSASSSANGVREKQGIVFPVDGDVSRSFLQNAFWGGDKDGVTAPPTPPTSDVVACAEGTSVEQSPQCPWLKKANLSVDALAEIRECVRSVESSGVHVGYVLTLSAEVALLEADETSPEGQRLLSLIPHARPSFSSCGNGMDCVSADSIMGVIFPFLKAKSRSDPDAIRLAEAFLLSKTMEMKMSQEAGKKENAPLLQPTEGEESTCNEALVAATAQEIAAKLAASVAASGSSAILYSETSAAEAVRAKGAAAIVRMEQRETAAIRKANSVLRDNTTDVWRLASYLLGKQLTRPKSGTVKLLEDEDALALQWILWKGQGGSCGSGSNGGGSSVPCQWKCVDFEAACVGEHEVAVPIEGSVVDLTFLPASPSPFDLLGAATEEHLGMAASTPSKVDTLIEVIANSTCFHAMINPGNLLDTRTAIRLATMGCLGGKGGITISSPSEGSSPSATDRANNDDDNQTTNDQETFVENVFGHGIPYDCLKTLRNDYRALAEELVVALDIKHIVLNSDPNGRSAEDRNSGQNKTVLVYKGPTLVDLNCIRWILAAANFEQRVAWERSGKVEPEPIALYDLTFESAKEIPLFDISAVAKLVGVVEHALEVRRKDLAVAAAAAVIIESASHPPRMTNAIRKERALAAEASYKAVSPPALPQSVRPMASLLCGCGYHWDLYESGCGQAIAEYASELRDTANLGPRLWIRTESGEDEPRSGPQDSTISVDIHCARSDAFVLQCQLAELLKRL